MFTIRSNVRSTYESWIENIKSSWWCNWRYFHQRRDREDISGQDADEQNDPTEDPTVEENDLSDITDAEGSVLEFQEETREEDVPSTEMVTEIPCSQSICAQWKSKITEKRKIVKSNL